MIAGTQNAWFEETGKQGFEVIWIYEYYGYRCTGVQGYRDIGDT